MVSAMVIGWFLGSVLIYSYLLVTAKETPFPECMDCHASECVNCSHASSSIQSFRMAA
jgi:hypothetical protein